MPFEHKTNSGSLFKNQRKERDEQPDYTGTMNIEGTVYRMSGWINKPQSGGPAYINMKFQEVESGPPRRRPMSGTHMDDDDIPF